MPSRVTPLTVKAEATKGIENNYFGGSEMDAPKGELNSKSEKTERTLEERNVPNDKSI
jgi:hypothetical protein